MVVDSSQLIHLCPVCDRPYRDKDAVRNHISGAQSGGHSGMSGYNLDRPIPSRAPQIQECDIEGRREAVETKVELMPGDNVKVKYKDLATSLDLPVSFVARVVKRHLDLVPVGGAGRDKSNLIIEEWGDLTGKQQDTLLAAAYFPEYTHSEIANLRMSGHGSQSQVSTTVRKYSWMFSHPDIDTPIEPTDDSSSTEGGVEYEGVADTLERITIDDDGKAPTEELEGDSGDETPGGSVEESEEPDAVCQECGESHDDGDCWDEENMTAEDPTHEDDEVVVELDTDLAFSAVSSLIETGNHADAHEIFEQAIDG